MPIGSLKADFNNIPPGTKLTVGSILFSMLDLPEEVAAPESNPGAAPAAGEQLQTQSAAKRSPDSSGASGTAPASGSVANGGGAGAAGGGEGDSFSRIEIRVGRITKVREENGRK